MNYLDILQDKEIMAILSQIDINKRETPKYYGIVHTLSTIEYAKQLADCFSLTEKERDLLLMACALHNIGHLNGRSLHAQTGAEMARAYLKQHKVPTKDITTICSAISSHTGRRGDNFYDSVSACMILADKMDFGATRIKPYFEPLGKEEALCKQITDVNVIKVGKTIELHLSSKSVNWKEFIESAIYSKIYRCFETVCKKHGFNFIARVMI